jgi:hypothetical protein
MVRSWVFEGVLEDPFLEFFIQKKDTGKDAPMWKDSYTLNHDFIPSFFSLQTATQVSFYCNNNNLFLDSFDWKIN